MNEDFQAVIQHYEAAIPDAHALVEQIGQQLDSGRPPGAEQLALLDQFHVGGLPATKELARRAKVQASDRVLDAGSGLGGPSRWLAATAGCEVDGVDLSPAFVAVADLLARRAGLDGRVRYQTGSITRLPFAEAHFDLIWTQHVAMNIPDRTALYREFRRVLKPGGRLAFYDPCLANDASPVLHPTPWADSPESSHLLTRSATEAALRQAGFELRLWDDVTSQAGAWQAALAQSAAPSATAGAPGIGLGLVMGPRMATMVANFQRNLREGRLALVMGVCVAQG